MALTSPGTLPLVPSQMTEAMVTELVVISGKGGTGKTSVVASFAVLAENAVIADCDVDAADLHLVLAPSVDRREIFVSGHEAVVRPELCEGCDECLDVCRFDALRSREGSSVPDIDPIACEGCGVCVHRCPLRAIDLVPRICGEWFVSSTRCGPMVHARLGIASENSGKLVSLVRAQARRAAARHGRDLIVVDGPPGIGCPVIAAMTGASAVLIVIEPTLSGEHDADRVLALAQHFDIPAAICVNRWDLCPELTDRIEDAASLRGTEILGRVRYDPTVTAAQVQGRAVVELGGAAADDIRRLWRRVGRWLAARDRY